MRSIGPAIILTGQMKAQLKQLDQTEHVYCVSHSLQRKDKGRKGNASMNWISAGKGAELVHMRPCQIFDQAPRCADGVANGDESSDLWLQAEQETIAGVDDWFLEWQRQAVSEHDVCHTRVIVEGSSDGLQRITGRFQKRP